MRIDFHTHVFPSVIRHDRGKFFSFEPAFKLLYQSPKSKLIGAGELLDAMDQNEVDTSVIFGFPWKNPETFKMHNDYIMDLAARHPRRFSGMGCFDLSAPESASEAERCLDGGLVGIGELAFYQAGIDETALLQLDPLMEICAARRLPVLIHTNEPVGHTYPGKTPVTLAQIYRMIKRFEANKIVLAHWGGGLLFYSLMKKDVKETLQNVYFDTAASPFLYDHAIYRHAVSLLGVDKILFGSDYPLLPPVRYFNEMQAAGLTPQQIDMICGGNAKQLLKLAGDQA